MSSETAYIRSPAYPEIGGGTEMAAPYGAFLEHFDVVNLGTGHGLQVHVRA